MRAVVILRERSECRICCQYAKGQQILPRFAREDDRCDRKKGSPKAPLKGWHHAERSRHATAVPRGARLTLPAFRQRVQTFTFSIFPSTTVRTTWRFGFQMRRVLLLACDTLLP